VRVAVTEISWDGSIRRSALETAGLPDAGRWEYLIEQVLAVPPRYQAAPGSPVYVIRAGARAVLVAEENLAGSLHALVSTILQAGSPALAAKQPATVSIAGHTHRARPRQMPDGDMSLAQPSPGPRIDVSRQHPRAQSWLNTCTGLPCPGTMCDEYRLGVPARVARRRLPSSNHALWSTPPGDAGRACPQKDR